MEDHRGSLPQEFTVEDHHRSSLGQITVGDHRRRSPREITVEDHHGRSLWKITTGVYRGRSPQEITAEDHCGSLHPLHLPLVAPSNHLFCG